MIVYLPDGRKYFECPYARFADIPNHFHVWEEWEHQCVKGERCSKCGLVRTK